MNEIKNAMLLFRELEEQNRIQKEKQSDKAMRFWYEGREGAYKIAADHMGMMLPVESTQHHCG